MSVRLGVDGPVPSLRYTKLTVMSETKTFEILG